MTVMHGRAHIDQFRACLEYLVEYCDYDIGDGENKVLVKSPDLWDDEDCLRWLQSGELLTVAFTQDVMSSLIYREAGTISATCVQARGPGGESLLHIIARSWAYTNDLDLPSEDVAGMARQWAQMLTDSVKSGADLHATGSTTGLENSTATPLAMYLHESVDKTKFKRASRYRLRALNDALQAWVTALVLANVDLEQYGRVEIPSLVHKLRFRQPFALALPAPRHMGFVSYGPRPQDWVYFESHMGDVYAGMIWEQVAHPERAMPGSCVEGSDDGAEDDEDFEDRRRWKARGRYTRYCFACSAAIMGVYYHCGKCVDDPGLYFILCPSCVDSGKLCLD